MKHPTKTPIAALILSGTGWFTSCGSGGDTAAGGTREMSAEQCLALNGRVRIGWYEQQASRVYVGGTCLAGETQQGLVDGHPCCVTRHGAPS